MHTTTLKKYFLVLCVLWCIFPAESVQVSSPVQNLNVAAINSTALNITWSGPVEPGITAYNVTVSSDTRGFLSTVTVDTNIGLHPNYENQELIFGGLYPFTEYNVTVVPFAGILARLPNTVLQSTLEAVPGAAILGSVNVINASTIRVSWFAPTELEQNGQITSFIIDFSNTIIPGPYSQTEETSLPFPISSDEGFHTDFTVEEGITYSVSVRAVNSAGAGASSDSISVTTPVAAPPALPPFQLSDISNETITPTSYSILITMPTIPFLNGPLLDYPIEYSGRLLSGNLFKYTSSSVLVETTGDLTTSAPAGDNITVVDLRPNYFYAMGIRARNAEGTTSQFLLDFTSTAARPTGVPFNISLLPVSYQQINVTFSVDFTTVNGELRYFNIYYYTAGYSNVLSYNITTDSLGPYTVSVSGLSPNTIYSMNVSIVNEVSEGDQSPSLVAETLPMAPNNVMTTLSPTQISSTTIQIYVPTQQLFSSADIAVIYIIADFNNPPLFSSYTANQRYNSVTSASSALVNVDATIRIQALLDASYYNQQTDYIQFTVGDGGTFLFNGLAVDNIPLRTSTNYQIGYYILFYNEDGQLTPQFSFYHTIDTAATTNRDICLACFLIPICAFVLIAFIFAVVFIALLYYFLWDKRDKKQSPQPVHVSPKKKPLKAVDSLVLVNRSMEESAKV